MKKIATLTLREFCSFAQQECKDVRLFNLWRQESWLIFMYNVYKFIIDWKIDNEQVWVPVIWHYESISTLCTYSVALINFYQKM